MQIEDRIESIVHVTDDTFEEEVIEADIPVMVDFWAPWCAPCRTMSKTLDQVAPEMAGKVKIAKVNVDENPAAASRYGIRSIPSLIFFRDAEPVGMVTGALAGDALKEILERHSRGEIRDN